MQAPYDDWDLQGSKSAGDARWLCLADENDRALCGGLVRWQQGVRPCCCAYKGAMNECSVRHGSPVIRASRCCSWSGSPLPVTWASLWNAVQSMPQSVADEHTLAQPLTLSRVPAGCLPSVAKAGLGQWQVRSFLCSQKQRATMVPPWSAVKAYATVRG
eukprot:1145861-Pelagomonas_calceolata.AAC.4